MYFPTQNHFRIEQLSSNFLLTFQNQRKRNRDQKEKKDRKLTKARKKSEKITMEIKEKGKKTTSFVKTLKIGCCRSSILRMFYGNRINCTKFRQKVKRFALLLSRAFFLSFVSIFDLSYRKASICFHEHSCIYCDPITRVAVVKLPNKYQGREPVVS